MAKSQELPVSLSVGTPLCLYGVAYGRVYGLSTSGLFQKSLRNPVWQVGRKVGSSNL